MELTLSPIITKKVHLGYEILGITEKRANEIITHIEACISLDGMIPPEKHFAMVIKPLKDNNELAYACIYIGRYLSHIEK